MVDDTAKLTMKDVQGLVDRANNPLPGPAFAAQETLRDTLLTGETAFADHAAFLAAQHAAEGFSMGE